MYLEAKMNPDDNYVLIVEEINRGDSYNIFGDVFQLLDRKIEKNENGEINESEYGVSIPESAKGFIRNIMKEDSDKDRFYFGVNVQAEKIDELNNLYNEICNTNKIKMPNNMFIVATANTDIAGTTRLDTAFLRRFSNVYMDLEGKVYGRPYDRHLLGFEKDEYKSDFTPENEECTIDENGFEDFRKYINKEILNDPNLNDDKLISKHFVDMDKNERDGKEYLHNEDFIINVLMYLRDNVFRDEDEFKRIVLKDSRAELNDLWNEKNIFDKVKNQ